MEVIKILEIAINAESQAL